MNDVTRILDAMDQGDPRAAEQLLPLVYAELRKLAAQKLAQEKPGQTLQPTALVHEAYLRLVPSAKTAESHYPSWDSRGHFFAAAAEAMRRILVENARRKKRHKHGGDHRRVDLEEHDAAEAPADRAFDLEGEVLALDDALTRLAKEDPAAAQVVQLHFFAGLSIEQVAEAVGVSRASAYRQWAYARVWLRQAIDADGAST
jgi:RNA polymerase sigma factor (TIGR02999 family)